ncbi:amidinotransferase [Poseidonibacter parvus]|uniref:Amidinotransferase n=1 Tax=Poseidonibacter parvus TaxID=1850254 RepID=A0A1P8KJP0_9BACT|nr:arginine deiminase-related protein [Poseidonibacter parvus]APW64744.1 amidinotransferase [Poseidonibacter parvus]
MSLIQSPNTIVMVRPWKFCSNPETSDDNAFQKISSLTKSNTAFNAKEEFNEVVRVLESKTIKVHIFDDFGEKDTPDSVFPNNWFSTHPGGHIAIYPMFSLSRRRERRQDIIEMLKSEYRVQDVIDFSGLEWDNLFLEGTGAMVLDHINRIAYTAKSNRSSEIILERFCSIFHYEPMAFDTEDENGKTVYHTNVMMSIGTKYALICLNMINDDKRRAEVKSRLEESGRVVIDLSFAQINNFAGNTLELTGLNGKKYLVISKVAYESLHSSEIEILSKMVETIPISIPTIELAGGSVRCMMAGIHLSKRK